MWLVVQVKYHVGASSKCGRDTLPECATVVGVRHFFCAGGKLRAWRVPLQIQFWRDAIAGQHFHHGYESVAIVGPAISCRYAINAEPAVFVHWQTDGIDMRRQKPIDKGLVA